MCEKGVEFRASVARSFANFAPCFYYKRELFDYKERLHVMFFCQKIDSF